jgi:hypothetical protein
MALHGRGRNYTLSHSLVEEALLLLYRSGWSARLAHRLGLPGDVRTVAHDLSVPGWPAGAPPLRLAFASDFHAGPTTHPALLQRACEALSAARPDVLLLGGDYIFLRAGYIDPLAEALGRVPAPLGRYAVLGNHDLWADDRYITRRLEENGVQVLVNRPVTLPPPHDHVSICGLDDAWAGEPDADAAFRRAAPTRVVLMHAPSGLLALGGRPFTVAFCGHTHGGHIALPGGVPIVVPGPLSRRYPHGRHRLGAGQGELLVSRGIGGVELALRLFADPDVLVCRLGA